MPYSKCPSVFALGYQADQCRFEPTRSHPANTPVAYRRLSRVGVWFVGVLVALAVSPPLTYAQPPSRGEECKRIDRLERSDRYDHYLAVEQGDEWLVCPSGNTEDSAYSIEVSGDVYFSWAIPDSDDRGVVYASTVAKSQQPLSLHRNSALGFFLSLAQLFRPIEDDLRRVDQLDSTLKKGFVEYHVDENDRSPNENLLRGLAQWHDTGLWGVDLETRDAVKFTLQDVDGELRASERGAERLIRVQGGRKRTSWISFVSQRPNPSGGILAVTLSYNGNDAHRFFFREEER